MAEVHESKGIPPLAIKNQKNLRTDGRSMRPLNYSKRSHSCTLAGSRQIRFEPTVALRRKSTVCGLNGQRAHFVIALSLATYEQTIFEITQLYRTFLVDPGSRSFLSQV
jgi:hypothetical protein